MRNNLLYYQLRGKGGNISVYMYSLYLLAIHVGFFTTTFESRDIIEPVRAMALVFFCGLLLISFLFRKIPYNLFVSLALFLLLVLYLIILSIIHNSINLIDKEFAINVLMIVFGIVSIHFYLHDAKYMSFDLKITKLMILFTFIGLLFTILVGGFLLKWPPSFNFGYQTELLNTGLILYSQGVSKVFGVGAIASFTIYTYQKKNIFLIGALLFMALSVIGGARGDSVFAIMVITLMACVFTPVRFVLFVIAIILLFVMVIDFTWVNDLLLFQRLGVMAEGDFGQRGFLILRSFELLGQNSNCVVFGCGFGFFQAFFDYEAGFYPHNIILEFIISYGLPICIVFITLIIRGIKKFISFGYKNERFFIFLYLYLILLNLKSGSLFSDWLFTSMSIFFITINFLKFSQSKIKL